MESSRIDYNQKWGLSARRQEIMKDTLDDVPKMLSTWNPQTNIDLHNARANLNYLDKTRHGKSFEEAEKDPRYRQLAGMERVIQKQFVEQIDKVIESCGYRDFAHEARRLEVHKADFQACAEAINNVGASSAPATRNAQIAAYARDARTAQGAQPQQQIPMAPGQYNQYQAPRTLGSQPNTPGNPGAPKPGRK